MWICSKTFSILNFSIFITFLQFFSKMSKEQIANRQFSPPPFANRITSVPIITSPNVTPLPTQPSLINHIKPANLIKHVIVPNPSIMTQPAPLVQPIRRRFWNFSNPKFIFFRQRAQQKVVRAVPVQQNPIFVNKKTTPVSKLSSIVENEELTSVNKAKKIGKCQEVFCLVIFYKI